MCVCRSLDLLAPGIKQRYALSNSEVRRAAGNIHGEAALGEHVEDPVEEVLEQRERRGTSRRPPWPGQRPRASRAPPPAPTQTRPSRRWGSRTGARQDADPLLVELAPRVDGEATGPVARFDRPILPEAIVQTRGCTCTRSQSRRPRRRGRARPGRGSPTGSSFWGRSAAAARRGRSAAPCRTAR